VSGQSFLGNGYSRWQTREMEYANVMKSPTILAAVLIGSCAAGGLIGAGSPQKNLSNIHLCTEIYRPPKAGKRNMPVYGARKV